MSGRLRVIMIEADGDSAAAALDAAIAVFAPQTTAVAFPAPAPAMVAAPAAFPAAPQAAPQAARALPSPKRTKQPRKSGVTQNPESSEPLQVNVPGFLGVTIDERTGQVSRDGKCAQLAGPALIIVSLAVEESSGVVSKEVARREIWAGSAPKWADQMLNGYVRTANERLKSLGLELTLHKAAIVGWKLGGIAG